MWDPRRAWLLHESAICNLQKKLKSQYGLKFLCTDHLNLDHNITNVKLAYDEKGIIYNSNCTIKKLIFTLFKNLNSKLEISSFISAIAQECHL